MISLDYSWGIWGREIKCLSAVEKVLKSRSLHEFFWTFYMYITNVGCLETLDDDTNINNVLF